MRLHQLLLSQLKSQYLSLLLQLKNQHQPLLIQLLLLQPLKSQLLLALLLLTLKPNHNQPLHMWPLLKEVKQ